MPENEIPSAERRPFLVAVIFWFHVLGAFSLVWVFFRLVTGPAARLRNVSIFMPAAAVVLITVKLCGAIALYRLRRSAVSFFLVAVLLNLPVTIYDVYCHPHGYPLSSILSMLAGVVFAAGSCVYALYLARAGTLK
jgi:uncharacterized membrane protein (DUF2068 family)